MHVSHVELMVFLVSGLTHVSRVGACSSIDAVARGAYVLADVEAPAIVLVASGSEVCARVQTR